MQRTLLAAHLLMLTGAALGKCTAVPNKQLAINAGACSQWQVCAESYRLHRVFMACRVHKGGQAQRMDVYVNVSVYACSACTLVCGKAPTHPPLKQQRVQCADCSHALNRPRHP
jgi:ABC-type Fe2+-enterobactin transport system substrate-binding protein